MQSRRGDGMYIINRIKNSVGRIVSYTVNNNGKVEILDSNYVIANAHLVTNAYLVDRDILGQNGV